jgi:hypothetical protein
MAKPTASSKTGDCYPRESFEGGYSYAAWPAFYQLRCKIYLIQLLRPRPYSLLCTLPLFPLITQSLHLTVYLLLLLSVVFKHTYDLIDLRIAELVQRRALRL